VSQCRKPPRSNLEYVQFNCPVGEYNPVASLLVNTSHSSVKLLFSGNNDGEILYRSSAVAFVAYFLLNVGLAGLPVPGGAFTATMVLGGLFGRCVGAFLREMGFQVAVSGVYAVVGASAMLCGFKQMAAAVVLIVVQCVNDFNMTPVVMLSVSVALAVNRAINERGHDEEQIERKGLPYLENEVPPGLDVCTASDLLDDLPAVAQLPPHATPECVERALEATDKQWSDFPILEGRTCVGVITRDHLLATLEALRAGFSGNSAQCLGSSCRATPLAVGARSNTPLSAPSSPPHDSETSATLSATEKARRVDAMIMARVASGLSMEGVENSPMPDHTIPLDRIMDPTPFTIVEDMPAARLYSLFAKAGERAACVTTKAGEFRGIVSRGGLIVAARQRATQARS